MSFIRYCTLQPATDPISRVTGIDVEIGERSGNGKDGICLTMKSFAVIASSLNALRSALFTRKTISKAKPLEIDSESS